MAITAPAYEPGEKTKHGNEMMGLYWHLFAVSHEAQSRLTHRKKRLWPSDFSQEAAPILPRYHGRLDMKPPAGERAKFKQDLNLIFFHHQ